MFTRRQAISSAVGAAVAAAMPLAWARHARGAASNSGGIPGYDGTIQVSGSGLVNSTGATVQLRGFNIQQQALAMVTNPVQLSPSGVPDSSGGLDVNDQAGTDNGESGSSAQVTAIGPNTAYMAPWKMNCIRIGINEASWLGYTTYSTTGASNNPDNYGAFTNLAYANQIDKQIAEANAAGLYVVLTLAFTHAGLLITDGQDSMANQDHSITCWQSIAARYGYPNGTALKQNGGTIDNRSVIFELFNEPFTPDAITYQGGWYNGYYQRDTPFVHLTGLPVTNLSGTFTPGEAFTAANGTAGTVLAYYHNTTTGLAASGSTFLHVFNVTGTNTSGDVFTTAVPIPEGTTITGSTSGATCQISTLNSGQYGWYVAGNQQMLAAIRAAGAGNVVLCSGQNYAHYLDNWLTYMSGQDATEPAGWSGAWTSQLGAHWHPYPPVSYINGVTVAGGGSGYAVNDTILLQMDESGGSDSNSCYWQAQLKVTSVSAGVITGVSINSYIGGTPGVAGGNNGNFGQNGNAGGTWYNGRLLGTLGQYSSSGSGTGATFNVTYTNVAAGGGADLTDWPTVVDIVTAGYPVAITETGEHTGTGIVGSPYMSDLTAWADDNGISFVAYAYTPSAGWYDTEGYDFSAALSTLSGSMPNQYRTPSPGYGAFMFNWMSTHAT